jgi:hypothetical protein
MQVRARQHGYHPGKKTIENRATDDGIIKQKPKVMLKKKQN